MALYRWINKFFQDIFIGTDVLLEEVLHQKLLLLRLPKIVVCHFEALVQSL